MTPCWDDAIVNRIRAAKRIWWFLDYDGTLADFAPNPDVILPNAALITLAKQLANQPQMRVTIISGRRLAHIEQLVPIDGIMKAGSYGLETRLPNGELQHVVVMGKIRPILDTIKTEWQALLQNRNGFYLEDKGWTLAIHAKDANPAEAATVITSAHRLANKQIADDDTFKLLGGDNFLEIGPRAASKSQTVERFFTNHPWPDALPVYLGDDDKDAAAFPAIQAAGGVAIAVGKRIVGDCQLADPASVSRWLKQFL
jgi:trehalose 6-phosphate phosphatase